MNNYSSVQFIPVLYDHACAHDIMPANKYLIMVHSMHDINLWYNLCMLKSYKSLSLKDMRPLLLQLSCY